MPSSRSPAVRRRRRRRVRAQAVAFQAAVRHSSATGIDQPQCRERPSSFQSRSGCLLMIFIAVLREPRRGVALASRSQSLGSAESRTSSGRRSDRRPATRARPMAVGRSAEGSLTFAFHSRTLRSRDPPFEPPAARSPRQLEGPGAHAGAEAAPGTAAAGVRKRRPLGDRAAGTLSAEGIATDDRLVALRADRDQLHRHADQRLDPLHVVARVLRQVLEAADLAQVLAPAAVDLVLGSARSSSPSVIGNSSLRLPSMR